mmetsp:Transcript_3770/g.12298  ORF Transcript_3770/g.12298 Transcript_3770/m.12298 type:complete len:724 (-) Transcript_3770:147-2318(-)
MGVEDDERRQDLPRDGLDVPRRPRGLRRPPRGVHQGQGELEVDHRRRGQRRPRFFVFPLLKKDVSPRRVDGLLVEGGHGRPSRGDHGPGRGDGFVTGQGHQGVDLRRLGVVGLVAEGVRLQEDSLTRMAVHGTERVLPAYPLDVLVVAHVPPRAPEPAVFPRRRQRRQRRRHRRQEEAPCSRRRGVVCRVDAEEVEMTEGVQDHGPVASDLGGHRERPARRGGHGAPEGPALGFDLPIEHDGFPRQRRLQSLHLGGIPRRSDVDHLLRGHDLVVVVAGCFRFVDDDDSPSPKEQLGEVIGRLLRVSSSSPSRAVAVGKGRRARRERDDGRRVVLLFDGGSSSSSSRFLDSQSRSCCFRRPSLAARELFEGRVYVDASVLEGEDGSSGVVGRVAEAGRAGGLGVVGVEVRAPRRGAASEEGRDESQTGGVSSRSAAPPPRRVEEASFEGEGVADFLGDDDQLLADGSVRVEAGFRFDTPRIPRLRRLEAPLGDLLLELGLLVLVVLVRRHVQHRRPQRVRRVHPAPKHVAEPRQSPVGRAPRAVRALRPRAVGHEFRFDRVKERKVGGGGGVGVKVVDLALRRVRWLHHHPTRRRRPFLDVGASPDAFEGGRRPFFDGLGRRLEGREAPAISPGVAGGSREGVLPSADGVREGSVVAFVEGQAFDLREERPDRFSPRRVHPGVEREGRLEDRRRRNLRGGLFLEEEDRLLLGRSQRSQGSQRSH